MRELWKKSVQRILRSYWIRVTMTKNIKITVFAVCMMLAILSACSSTSYQARDKSHGETDLLNYSYTNEYFKKSVQKEHFRLSVSVDSPAIIKFGKPSYNPVHIRAGAEGNAVLRIAVTPGGQVTSIQFIKKAGVGLDKYIEETIRKSKFIPVVYKGKEQNSGFIVNVVIKEL